MRKILWHKYEILRLLGEGACSQVFLARDLHLNRLVAVKEENGKAICAEMELLKEMEHPGLPKVLDFFEEKGNRYLVMEYIEGTSLRQLLKGCGTIPMEKAIQWSLELCRILQYLHKRKPPVIYRDLKPENIMIKSDGRVCLVDLGAALKDDRREKEDGMCAGTPGYSPREQWTGARVETEVDIYGLGAVLHEMITGVCPLDPLYCRRPIREYDRSFPENLEELILSCTADKPGDRPDSLDKVEYGLLHYRDGHTVCSFFWKIKRAVMGVLFAVMLGFLAVPLLKGVQLDQIPFPYLEKPLCILELSLLISLLPIPGEDKKSPLRRREKSIWLTEKRFSGLYLLLVGCLACTGSILLLHDIEAEGADAGMIWVEMRDEQGRKLLLKEGAYYQAVDKVRLEIPAERLPEENVALQLTAVGESGSLYNSRIFHIASSEDQSNMTCSN